MGSNANTDVDELITFGQMALEQGWYDQAREYFEQALALDPSNREAMKGLARANEVLSRKAATAVEPMEAETPPGPPLAKRLLVGVNSVFEALEGYSQKRAKAWEERAQKRAEEQSRKRARADEPGLFGISQGHSVGIPNLLGPRRDKLQQVGNSGPLSMPTPKDPEPVEPTRESEPPRKVVEVVVDATDLPTLLLAVLDIIKQEGLNIVEIWQGLGLGTLFKPYLVNPPFFDSVHLSLYSGARLRAVRQNTLCIKAKRKLLEQIEIDVRSSGVMFTPDTDLAMHIAAVFQSILKTQQYPTDSEQIIDYAKQRLEGVWKDQQELFLEFLENWIQWAEIISRLAERIDEEPLNPNAHFELAEAIFYLGRPDAAKRYYTMALALEPGPRAAGVANLRLGSMMPASRRLGSRVQILADWEEARHRFEQAVEGLEEYLRTNPNDPEAWRELSDTYSCLGYVYHPSRLNNPRARNVAQSESGRASRRARMLQPESEIDYLASLLGGGASVRAKILQSLPPVQEKAPEAPLKHKGGLAFEEKCLRLIRAMGFHAQTTKQTGDGGIDIIATSTQPLLAGKYVIQCKDWSAPVGVSPVRDLYGVVASERANKGILITSSTFTKPAQDFAQGKQLELIDGEELERLYQIHVGKS